jgi:hypothetical protein
MKGEGRSVPMIEKSDPKGQPVRSRAGSNRKRQDGPSADRIHSLALPILSFALGKSALDTQFFLGLFGS